MIRKHATTILAYFILITFALVVGVLAGRAI